MGGNAHEHKTLAGSSQSAESRSSDIWGCSRQPRPAGIFGIAFFAEISALFRYGFRTTMSFRTTLTEVGKRADGRMWSPKLTNGRMGSQLRRCFSVERPIESATAAQRFASTS